MSVTPKEKKQLQDMWDGAEAAGQELPDGTYQFEAVSARFHMTDKGKPQFKTKIKVVGGDQEYVGQELEINDNLETKENMGWFKKKLQRLNINSPEDFEEITDGTVADQIVGKVFEGQVKTKNDFMNVYVNRLIGEGSGEEKTTKKSAAKEEKEEVTVDFEEGDDVTWGNGKTGKVVEILADDAQARVEKEDETIVRVSLDMLSKVEKKSKGKEDKEEKEEKDEEFQIPEPDEVEDMKASAVKAALGELSFDAEDIAKPREVLHAFCTLAHDEDAKIELEEVSPLAMALDVTVKKGETFKDTLKKLSKAVQERIG